MKSAEYKVLYCRLAVRNGVMKRTRVSSSPKIVIRCSRERDDLALEVASCVVHADVGDVLLLHPDVFHRTQDMAVSRLALLAEAM